MPEAKEGRATRKSDGILRIVFMDGGAVSGGFLPVRSVVYHGPFDFFGFPGILITDIGNTPNHYSCW